MTLGDGTRARYWTLVGYSREREPRAPTPLQRFQILTRCPRTARGGVPVNGPLRFELTEAEPRGRGGAGCSAQRPNEAGAGAAGPRAPGVIRNQLGGRPMDRRRERLVETLECPSDSACQLPPPCHGAGCLVEPIARPIGGRACSSPANPTSHEQGNRGPDSARVMPDCGPPPERASIAAAPAQEP